MRGTAGSVEFIHGDTVSGISLLHARVRAIGEVRATMAEKPSWLSDSAQIARAMKDLIALWDMHSDRAWAVPPERHGVNVAMVNAYVSHSVNLSRAVLLMHENRLTFESVSLVRSTMEATMTAAWLALYPEKTPDFVVNSSTEKGKVLKEIDKAGYASDGGTALAQIDETVADFDGTPDLEARHFYKRCKSMEGGAQVYAMYRVLCTWDHATNDLADAYTQAAEQSEKNPWGLVLMGRVNDDYAGNWLGIQLSLLLRAQIAADMILVKPRHRTQLRKLATRMGVSPLIERVGPSPAPESDDEPMQ